MNWLIIGVLAFVIASLMGINLIKSGFDLATGGGNATANTPDTITKDATQKVQENLTLPIWLLLIIIILIFLAK